MFSRLFPFALSLFLAACASTSHQSSLPDQPIQEPKIPSKGGGYYQNDGPGDTLPADLESRQDATVRWEPLHKPALKPYTVLGKSYVPHTKRQPYKDRGIASWYGKKFHGQKTANGETYDMFGMTAAHTTLPLPSYVRVTRIATGKSVVVRVNDRGPFHAGRIIDLSYTAAHKLGLIAGGSGEVEIEAILPSAAGDLRYAEIAPPPRPASPPSRTPVLRASPESAVVMAESDAAPGIYLQLGAFANVDNATNMGAHLSRELDSRQAPIAIYKKPDGIYRLQAGPFDNRQAADAFAETIRREFNATPVFIKR